MVYLVAIGLTNTLLIIFKFTTQELRDTLACSVLRWTRVRSTTDKDLSNGSIGLEFFKNLWHVHLRYRTVLMTLVRLNELSNLKYSSKEGSDSL